MSEILDWEELSITQKQLLKQWCEDDFLDFTRIFFQLLQGDKLKINWHHRYMAWVYMETVEERMTNVVVNVPPGSLKTELFSIHAPAWSIIHALKYGRRVRNLNISFSDSLTKENSSRTRDIVGSEEFQALWPVSFGQNKIDDWKLIDKFKKVMATVTSRSGRGQITGRRGGYPTDHFSGAITLDDFDKPEDMFSPVRRAKNKTILTNTIRSRRGNKTKRNPTPIISVQQRLHVDDSTAFMLSGGMGLKFEHIKIPALIDEDYIKSLPAWLQPYVWEDIKDSECIDGYYSFCPAIEDINDLMASREADEYTFASQYMQEPRALGGLVFDPDWWCYYADEASEGVEKRPEKFGYRFITADTAQKTKERNDFSVFCLWGYFKGKIYLIDMMRGKWEAPDLEKNFIDFCNAAWVSNREDGVLRKAYVEDKSSGTGLIQSAAKKIRCGIIPLQRNVDKVTRAMDAQSPIKMGKVLLPYGKKFLTDFIYEHSQFTYDDTHKHDDIVDNTMDAVNIELNLSEDALEKMKRLGG